MPNYVVEFILYVQEYSIETVKNSIASLGDGLAVTNCIDEAFYGHGDYRIQINTQDPTIIFDTCAQFGRIKSVKIA